MFLAFRETKMKENPERAQPLLDKAEEAQELVNKLTEKLKEYNQLLTEHGGGISEETGDVKFRSNTDVSARLMINQNRGKELRDLINTTAAELHALTGEEVNFSLSAEDPAPRGGVRKSWEQANFGDGIPLTAAITALEKINADAKNAESAVIKHIFGKMDQAVVNLDKFAAVAVAPSSYLIAGQPYTAKVFLTAYDSKSTPQITVNGSAIPVVDGQGTYTITPGVGTHTWRGAIRVQQTDGTVKEYETEPMTFQVAKPSAIVSPDAMNVLYIGVDNPISVSAPGIPLESVKVSGSGVSLTARGDGKYIARVTNPGDVSLNVTATIDGTTQNMGATRFRVKRIPKPTARVAGKEGGAISAAQLRGQTVVSAALDNFDFDAKFRVTKFNMYIVKPRVDPIALASSSGSFTSQMTSALGGLTAGSVVYIYNVVGVGPDGTAQNLNDISFRITN
jgi:gliding motility-associated protein GldM